MLILLIGLATLSPPIGQAGTVYVISTDGGPVTEQLVAFTNVYGQYYPVFYGPADLGGIGVSNAPLTFGCISNNIAYFGVAGDLVLREYDAILAVGTNCLRLEVAHDARIENAIICAQAFGTKGGPGGGNGGLGGITGAIETTSVTTPGGGGCPMAQCGPSIDYGTYAAYQVAWTNIYPRPCGSAGENPTEGLGLLDTSQGGCGNEILIPRPLAAGGLGFVSSSFEGQDGHRGLDGWLADDAYPSHRFLLGDPGLHGGAGGGGGGAGGYGLAGGGGGGGFTVSGGGGGTGGRGGSGGNGGGGGGGFELIVRGTCVVNGLITTAGADASPGVPGEPGGNPYQPGDSTGGAGGHGGNGADGGAGAGGSGGTLNLAANLLIFGASNKLDAHGGWGNNRQINFRIAPEGPIQYRSDLIGSANSIFAPTTVRFNPYVGRNMLNVEGTYHLVGGIDTFGLFADPNDPTATIPDTAVAAFFFQLPHPPNAVGAVIRLNVLDPFTPSPQLFFMNMTSSSLRAPALSVYSGDPIPLRPLQVRGYLREPLFVPGAAGAEALTALPPGNSWLTYIPAEDSMVKAAFTPYTNVATFSMVTRSTNQNDILWLLDTGLLSVDLTITGMTPRHYVLDRDYNVYLPDIAHYWVIRAGPPASISINVKNTGSSLSRMSTFPPSFLEFTNLSSSDVGRSFSTNLSTASIGYSGPDYWIITDAGSLLIQSPFVNSPLPAISVSNNGDAGAVALGQSGVIQCNSRNLGAPTTYGLDESPTIYELNILGMTITGPDAACFSLPGRTTARLPDSSTNFSTSIVFTPVAARRCQATLNVTTDFLAQTGSPGQVYTFPLSGTGILPSNPLLSYSVQGAALRLAWNVPGFVLQRNSDLANPAGWTNVPAGNISPVLITPGPGKSFFRLKVL